MSEIAMTSSRPYLLRALYEWIMDNGLTPHIVVDCRDERVIVPREFAKDGQIVLNIAARAVGHFSWDNESLSFSARFSGVSRTMQIPMWSIIAIHARENGAGMMLGPADIPLTEHSIAEESVPPAMGLVTSDRVTDRHGASSDNNEPEPPEPPKPVKANRPSLKVVK